MKMNKWTTGLTAAGVVSLASVAQAGDANETVMTAVSSTTLSGYVSTTAIWNPGTGNAAGVPNVPFRGGSAAAQDGFNLDVVSITLSKSLDESEWAAGYNAQLWFGESTGTASAPTGLGATTAPGGSTGGTRNDTVDPGTATGGMFPSHTHGVTGGTRIRNANVALRVPVGNGIDIKMGIFDTIIGYESADFNANPNYSRSFGWGLEPTTHEGVLLSYNVNEMISVSAGVANANIPTLGGLALPSESQKSYMGAVALTAPDSMGFLSGANLYVGVVDGLVAAGNLADTTSIYVGATIPTPVEGLAAGVSWDYRLENGPSAGVNTGTAATSGAWASALAGYISYDVTEKIAAHYRIDWAQGTDGTFGAGLPTNRADNNITADKVLSNTLTLDYKAWENVISRLELRWDHSLDAVDRYGATDRNDITVAANVIYQF
jgi:hypothetical protein